MIDKIQELQDWHNIDGRIALYGAGQAGMLIYNIMTVCGINVDFFIDNSEEKAGKILIDDIFCLQPAKIKEKEKCVVFISVTWVNYLKVCKKAKEDGFTNIVEFSEVLDSILLFHRELLPGLLKCIFENKNEVDIFVPARFVDPTVLGEGQTLEICDRVAVYTGNFGSYDYFCEPSFCPEQVDYYFISDQKPEDIQVYHWIDAHTVIPKEISNPVLRNRYIKMHPHEIFRDYKYTIYIDANIEIKQDITKYLTKSGTGISVFSHYNRDCLFYEMLQIVNYKRAVWEDVYPQMDRYLSEGMPLHYGLGEMPVIALDHHKEPADIIMHEWWTEFLKGAFRDQFSFMYVLWKQGFTASDITSIGNDFRLCNDFTVNAHIAPSKFVTGK